MNKINCEHPVVILHPSYIQFLHKYSHICRFDYRTNNFYIFAISSEDISLIESGESFYKVFDLPYPRYVKDFQDFFFSDLETGERQDIYLYVPCGKCSVCEQKKTNSLVQRMQFALEYDVNSPLFVTLTYNDSHLPSDGVSRRDVTNFKKRLNKLVSSVFPDVHLKYCFFSEYGKLGRPHYHGIIYGFPLHQLKAIHGLHYFIECVRMIQYCWRKTPKSAKKSERLSFSQYKRKNYRVFENDLSDKFSFGFVNVNQTNNTSCFFYVSKYIGKGSNVPSGKNKNFHSFSINLGVSFVNNLKDYLFNDKRTLKYLSIQDGKVKEVNLCSYYIKKLFPSLSNVVSVETRRKWYRFNELSSFFISNSALPSWYRDSVLNHTLYIHRKLPCFSLLFPFKPFHRDSLFVKEQSNYAFTFYNDFVYTLGKEFSGTFDSDGSAIYFEHSYVFKDNFYSEFHCLFRYFDSFSPGFNDYVFSSIFKRDLFLSGLKFFSDSVIASVKSRRNKSIQLSKTKLF